MPHHYYGTNKHMVPGAAQANPKHQGDQYACRYFCTALVLAAFAAVTVALTGVPGYVKPRFSVFPSATNGAGAGGKAGVRTDSDHWRDLAALDPEAGMWSHHQKRQRMKHEAAVRHHERRQQATGTAVHGEDPQVGAVGMKPNHGLLCFGCFSCLLGGFENECRSLLLQCLFVSAFGFEGVILSRI